MKYKDFKMSLEFLQNYGFEYCKDSTTGKLFGILIHPDYLKNNM